MTLREFCARFFRVHTCAGCHKILKYENFYDAFCPACHMKWNFAKAESCKDCYGAAVECVCMPKGLSKQNVSGLSNLMFYRMERQKDPQNQILYIIKRKRIKRYADFLADELSFLVEREMKAHGIRPDDAVIVGIPRGVRAKCEYGFDQSELIGTRLAKKVGIPYVKAIGRRLGGKTQKNLNRAQRMVNMRSRFKLKGDARYLKDKHVFLFDDIVTTGATMAAGAHFVKMAGAKSVFCICIAQN